MEEQKQPNYYFGTNPKVAIAPLQQINTMEYAALLNGNYGKKKGELGRKEAAGVTSGSNSDTAQFMSQSELEMQTLHNITLDSEA